MSTTALAVYAIRHRASGRMYIGQSKSVYSRWQAHNNDLVNGRHLCRELQSAWDESGAAGFEFIVLESVDDPNTLHIREAFWIQQYNPDLLFNDPGRNWDAQFNSSPRPPSGKEPTKATSFRLTLSSFALLQEIAKKLGITQTAVLEILLREKAKEILRQ